MPFVILAVAVILIICLSLSKVSSKLGVPMLLVFILLGMLFGTDGLLKINFDDYVISEKICSVALIFIMFYGGFGTNWKKAKPIAVKSALLSSFGVILTAAITGLFCHFVLRFDFLESMLIGSVISSTDAASVFSVLRSKHLNLKNNTASLLEVESGSNDPCSYMLTVVILSFMSGQSGGEKILWMIFSQILFGALVGIAVALAGFFILKKIKFPTDGFDSIFVFSLALVSYSAAALLGGNGYLSTYITGIILGNKPIGNKKSLVHFFDGVTGLMQIFIFFLLGLLSFPSQLPQIVLPALAIALFLTFVARPLSVFAVLTPFRCPFRQQLLVSWAGLRGAASIVFAIMATVSPAYTKTDVFHIVFFIVLFSISLQGSLIPFVAKKLKMIDDDSDVMKTFSDYSAEVPVQFLNQYISPEHPWAGKKVKDVSLLPDTLLALMIRDGKHLVPRGGTVILAGDEVVLSGRSIEDKSFGSLMELKVEQGSEWLGKPLSELELEPDKLVILIKRGNKVVMPAGKTVIQEADILIMNQLP